VFDDFAAFFAWFFFNSSEDANIDVLADPVLFFALEYNRIAMIVDWRFDTKEPIHGN